MTPLQILCQWAWAKVNLKQLQEGGDISLIEPAIVAYRHALRKKKQLDEEYRELHEELARQESQPVLQYQQQLLPL